MHELSEIPEHRRHEREAVLFNAAVRALGAVGYSKLQFDIGGKKARRRYVAAIAPNGDARTIWIKRATQWPDRAEAVRFPWKNALCRRTVCQQSPLPMNVRRNAEPRICLPSSVMTTWACCHLLGSTPWLRLQTFVMQSAHTDSIFYRPHSAALIA